MQSPADRFFIPLSLDVLSGNRLLEALPDAEQAFLLPRLTRVQIAAHEVLYEADQPIPHVWFPLHGGISLITLLYEGATVEVAVVGNEGMVGLPVFLGVDADAHQAQGQLPGEALRMEAAVFRTAAAGLPGLQTLLLRYAQVLLVQTSQGAACNARHEVTERCARWLLEAHDRVRRDHFPLTQDFLAGMLGVRRASVTVAAGILQQAGFIRYERGQVTIRDREGLEASACECYRFITDATDRLLGAVS